MYFKDIITLISIDSTAQNDLGDNIPTTTSTQVYADVSSVRQSEHYAAFATGLKPEIMFIIHSSSYDSQEFLYYNTVKYKIIRTYIKANEHMELICEKVT